MNKTLRTNPKQDGFQMPAEFDRHYGTLMLFPFRTDVWREQGKPAQEAFFEVAKAIARQEPVFIGVHSKIYQSVLKRFKFRNISFFKLDYNDAWMRDVGPTFVRNLKGILRGIDWKFNAWGGKVDGLYAPWDLDDRVASQVLSKFSVDRYRTENFVLEGGAIHVDGEGLALVTEACLLSKGRNPKLSKANIETLLKDYLGVEKVIWLPRGIYLDETNEHVDNIACFVKPGHVLLAVPKNKQDPQYALSMASFKALKESTTIDGKKIKITRMPMPEPIYRTVQQASSLAKSKQSKHRLKDERLAASYVNFYFANGALIVPSFDQPEQDEAAYVTLRKIFPNKKIVMIPSLEILLGGGNIHCITQQIPLGGK